MKINNKIHFIILATLLLLLVSSCAEEVKPFDSPFVYLTDKFGGISAPMDSEANFTATYYVKLSSKTRTQNLEVYYKFVAGNGLQEGVDYKIPETNLVPIVFAPGEYEKTIEINWLRNNLDDSKDNTLKIMLESTNDPSVHVGRIGPDKLGSVYTITKE